MFTFYKGLATAPTTAPAIVGVVDNINGYRMAYRIKTDSGVTAISQLTVDAYALPITANFPSYVDQPPGFQYELVALSAGSYFTLGSTNQSTLNVFSAPLTSPLAYVTESFSSGTPEPNMGVFSSTSSPSVDFYAKYTGLAVGNVIVDVLKGVGERATELFGQVLVDYLGKVGPAGVLDQSNATSVYWDNGIKSTNTLTFPALTGEIHKFRLSLVNYAPTGFAVAATNSFRLELYTSPKSYPYPSAFDLPSPLVFPVDGLGLPTLTVASNTATLGPIRVYHYGRMIVIGANQTSSVSATADRLVMHIDGTLRALEPADSPTAQEFVLYVWTGSEWVLECNLVPPVPLSGVSSAVFQNGDLVYLDTSTYNLTTSGTLVGVALHSATSSQVLHYASTGKVLVRTTASSIAGVGVAIGPQYGPYRLYKISV